MGPHLKFDFSVKTDDNPHVKIVGIDSLFTQWVFCGEQSGLLKLMGAEVGRSLKLQRREMGCGFLWWSRGEGSQGRGLHSLILLLASRREHSDFLISLFICGAEEKRQLNTKSKVRLYFFPSLCPSFFPFFPVHLLLVEIGLFYGVVRKAFCRPMHGRLRCSKVIPYS
ncbi:hypothetical protein HJG60_010340 [Phyllostomus discolor]|uniref:Uncharacterized protein n=1 Tax=Phyllostomus discolor TaxID=89673 RepID=A0A834ASZ7_9CHIR|nr:hypothetical protein HJG60_010340 [Phyllostomus discolor]